jgi:hypothetical protein
MWEWIAIATGVAVLGLYGYALVHARSKKRDPSDREESGVPPSGE